MDERRIMALFYHEIPSYQDRFSWYFTDLNLILSRDCGSFYSLAEWVLETPAAQLKRSFQLSREIEIDRVNQGWYFGGMKIKTSITLSNEVLKAIDLYIGEYRSRSEFIETATRKFIAQLARKEAERRDLELINRHSASLNAEAEDVLTYQVPL